MMAITAYDIIKFAAEMIDQKKYKIIVLPTGIKFCGRKVAVDTVTDFEDIEQYAASINIRPPGIRHMIMIDICMLFGIPVSAERERN